MEKIQYPILENAIEIPLFNLGFSDNVRHRRLLRLLMADGVELHCSLVIEDKIPRVVPVKNSERATNFFIILLPEVRDYILDYLYTGCYYNQPKYLANNEIPDYRVEDNYIERFIKYENNRGAAIFTDEQQNDIDGVRITAKYPFGSIDYGFQPYSYDQMIERIEEVEAFDFDTTAVDIPELHNHTLPIDSFGIKQGGYLSTVFADARIPTNIIIDKTICGIGATYMEIKALRNSIIIEPNVPVIIGKAQRHNEIIPVYGEKIKSKDIVEKIKNNNHPYVKLMTTPESLPKIIKAFKILEINCKKDYFLLLDECEKFVADIDFRKNIFLPIDDFFEFDNKAMVSATPIVINDPRFEEQGFRVVKIEPLFDYKKPLELYPTNNITLKLKRVLKTLNSETTPICIFYNSIRGIEGFIDSLKIGDITNIYCSTDSAKELRKAKYNVFDSVTDKKGKSALNQINFFTSRFYSAVDIELDYKPIVILLSNVYKVRKDEAPYAVIDPETEAIQIVGRFRNGVDRIMHITNTKSDPNIKLKADLEFFLHDQHKAFLALLKLMHAAETDGEKFLIGDSLWHSTYNQEGYVTEDDRINYFRYNKAYLDERIKLLYRCPAALYKSYNRSAAFYVVSQSEYMLYSEEELKILNDTDKPKQERIESLYSVFCRLNESSEYYDKRIIDQLKQEYGLYIEAFSGIGYGKIKELEFKDSAIREAVKKYNFKRSTNYPNVISEIYAYFSPNTTYPTNVVNDNLSTVFDKHKIGYDKRGCAKHISIYFDAKEKRRAGERFWELGAKLY